MKKNTRLLNQKKSCSVLFWVFVLGVGVLFQGCATTTDLENKETESVYGSVGVNLHAKDAVGIHEGMSLAEVSQVMGKEIVVGYNSDDPTQPMKPVVIKNPYKVELISAGGHDYSIFYFVSTIKKSDGMITDDELLPVIFENEVVVGQGWKNVLIIKANAADES